MLSAARAYLANVPDAKVDLITFDRHATSVFGRFMGVPHADMALSMLAMGRNNGSNVQSALTLAAKRLAGAPKRAPKRVVLFTDTMTKAALQPKHLGLDKVGGVLHVAIMDESTYGLTARDHHAWAAHVEKTGGLIWEAGARPKTDLASQKVIFEELVRPIRIHDVKLSVPSAPGLALSMRDGLHEGTGISGLSLATDTDPRVHLTGRLWSKPLSIKLNPSLRETKLWEGMLLGSKLADRLTDSEALRLALKADVATKHTGFVTATKGRRHVMGAAGGTGFGSSFSTSCRMSPRRTKQIPFARPDKWLQKTLGIAYEGCGGAHRAVQVRLEMTLNEVVDVKVTAADTKLSTCVAEAAWNLVTPAGFAADNPRSNFSVTLP
jgi:hypothetical protein